jgi:hypothetical protein
VQLEEIYLGQDVMEPSKLLGLAEDLQLNPYVIKVRFDEAYLTTVSTVIVVTSKEEQTKKQVMHRVNNDHPTKIKVR